MESTAPPAAGSGWVRPAVAWLGCAAASLLAVVTVTLTLADHRSLIADDLATGCVVGVGAALLAAFVVTRHPGNPVGWLFAVTGLSRALTVAADAWCVRALVTEPGSLPWGPFASWVQAWGALPGLALAPVVAVLFPDGRLPGRRWRVVPVLAGVALVLFAVVVPAGMWPYRGPRLLPGAPIPDTPGAQATNAALVAGAVVTVVSILLALASLVVRARRRRGEQRQQLKWFGYAAGCAVTLNLLAILPGLAWLRLLGVLAVLTGLGLGIFRYRLYAVDRLINRTLVYGILSVALLAGFAALDVTLAVVIGRSSVLTAAVSAFVVALLLRPGRDRVQDLVDRTFDRRTHDSVRLLHALGQRVGHERVDPQIVVSTLQRALHDPDLRVYFRTRQPPSIVDGNGAAVDQLSVGAGQVADPVNLRGAAVAVLVHVPVEPALLAAVLRAAAVVLEHARVQVELLVQLAEVRASRARLAAAADAERRRIERDLHDGAQQRLVGLALHVQSAKRREAYPPGVVDLLTFTVEQLHAGVEDIRALVHGILPPALAASGLPAALQDLALRGEVSVACRITDRLDPGVEAAAWFVACEGVANATKHAPGRLVRVEAATAAAWLTVTVSDDGPGKADPAGDGLRNLADRVEAHGGRLTVHSPPGAGTRLVAELPCAS